MLKIIEQQESYVIKHRSKNMKKTDEGFAGFLQTLDGFFENNPVDTGRKLNVHKTLRRRPVF